MSFAITIPQLLSIIGLPSVLSICAYFYHQIRAQKLGLQALLRSQMINDYNCWSVKGYAPIYARENFENVWQQYHNLGANGVMNDIRDKFMALPTQHPHK